MALVYFYSQPSAILSISSTSTYILARIHERDFEHMYHALQTEDPVYFDWLDGDYFRLTTSEEWPGEGYEDLSPLAP